MKEITQEQMGRLFLATDLARKPGACRYEDGGRPCCVIAQLAVIEAPSVVTVDVLKQWETGETVDALLHPAVAVLEPYGLLLLKNLQAAWDIKKSRTAPVAEARERVRNAIRQHYAVLAS